MLTEDDKKEIEARIARLKANQAKITIKPAKESPKTSNLKYSSAGFEFIFHILIFSVIGYYLDKKFGTNPWLLLLLMTTGTASGMRRMINIVNKAQ